MYQFPCIQQNTGDNSKVHSSFQKCEGSIWALLHIILLVLGKFRLLPDYWKICRPLEITLPCLCLYTKMDEDLNTEMRGWLKCYVQTGILLAKHILKLHPPEPARIRSDRVKAPGRSLLFPLKNSLLYLGWTIGKHAKSYLKK